MSILLTDRGQHFGHSADRLNHALHQTTRGTLTALGHAVKETIIEESCDKDAEVGKQLWIDAVVWQMPGWWVGKPWTAKKYTDEMFTADMDENKLMANDDRCRVNPTEGYGTGGLLHGKEHMISSAWNTPIGAFAREGDFFEGASVDDVYLHFHRANEFPSTTRLPSFICNDVIKDPQVKQYLADYRTHLEKAFGRGQGPQVGHEYPAYRQ